MATPPHRWWSSLNAETQEWLITHNGDEVPRSLVEELEEAAGEPAASAWWAGEQGPEGTLLSDEAVDWIEAIANGETPSDPRA